jgi:hypothetical protein
MAITGLIRAAGSPRRTRATGLSAAAAVLLGAALLGGCGGGDGGAPALAARSDSPSKPAANAPTRTMRLEKEYKDQDGNRFTIELAIRPTDSGDRCFEMGPPDGFSHSMVMTLRSEAAKGKKVRLPRIAARDKHVIFAGKDNTGTSCSTVVSTTVRTVLGGGQKKDFDAFISRPKNLDGNLVLTVWPKGKPQEELVRVPFNSLP